MNHHPLHLNQQFAENSQHGRILVVGTLIFSLVVGITVPDISGKAIANLGYEKVEHVAPVFIGDTIYARTKIISARMSKSKNDRGIISVETIGYNQNGIDVIKLCRRVLVSRRAK